MYCRPRLVVICTLQFLAHLSGGCAPQEALVACHAADAPLLWPGISALLNFVPTILEEVGFSDKFMGQ
jgi:hypothetical protein